MGILSVPNLILAEDDIYQAMAQGKDRIHKRVQETVVRMRTRALEIIEGKCIYDYFPLKAILNNHIELSEGQVITCNTRVFKGATHVVFLVATLGRALDAEVAALFKEGNYLEGLALDACGTAALNEVTGALRQELREKVLASGQKQGHLLSPGCQRIPLSEQAALFSLLEPSQIGVDLNESFIMLPLKSTSALIPVGNELAYVSEAAYACELCNIKGSCQYRTKTS